MRTRKVGRAIALVAVVAALIVLGVALAVPSRDALAAAAGRLARVHVAWLVLAALCALAPAIAEAARVRIAGRMVGVSIAPATALDAAVANAFFTSVTPVTGVGEPSVAWILARSGVPTDAAVLVPFVKFTTSFIVVFAAGALVFAVGAGPPGAWLGAGGALVTGAAAAGMALVLVGARRPARAHAIATRGFGWLARRRFLAFARAQRWIARADAGLAATLHRLAGVRRRGFALLIASHALYYAVYVAPIAVLCEGLVPGTGLVAMPRALAYLCVLFLAPTPGGAGVGEATAAVFFGDLIGAADAVVVVLAYRVGRILGQVVVPGIYLAARGLAGLRAGPPAG